MEEAGNTISEPCEENEPHDDMYEIYGMQFDGIAPETCVGYSRLRKFGNRQKMKPNVLNTAIDQDEHLDNVVYLRGPWIWENEGVRACPKIDATASIVMKYNAATRVHAIMGTIDGTDTTTKIYLDGKPVETDQLGRNVALVNGSSICAIKHPIIYNLINTQTAGTHEIEIVASSDNTIIYTFVFG